MQTFQRWRIFMISIINEPLTYGFFGYRILPKFSFCCFVQPMTRNLSVAETNILCEWKDITISIHLGMNFSDWTCDFKSESEFQYCQFQNQSLEGSRVECVLEFSYPNRITSFDGWFSYKTSVNSFVGGLSGVEFLLPISAGTLDSNFSNMTQLTNSREVRVIFSCH